MEGALRRAPAALALPLALAVLLSFTLHEVVANPGNFVRITIFHTNDLHGQLLPSRVGGECVGGLAYIAYLVNEARRAERERGGYVLLFDCGDFMSGSLVCDFFRGASVIECMNALGYNACVLGNHEFDWGLEVTAELIKRARFPVLSCNAVFASNGTLIARPYVILEVGGVRVGVVGVTTCARHITLPSLRGELDFLDPFKEVQRYVSYLRRQGVGLIIVLSHLGFGADVELAKRVKGVSVILGGHAGGGYESVNGVLVGQAEHYGRSVGKVVLLFDRLASKAFVVKCELIPVRAPPLKEDPTIASIIESYDEVVSRLFDVEVCSLNETLSRGEICRICARELVELTGAAVGFLNRGSVRVSLSGRVRLRDVFRAMPFPDYIVTCDLKGRYVKELLRRGLCYYGAEVRGGRCYLVNGSAIRDEVHYRVATTDFLLLGGDRVTEFRHARNVRYYEVPYGFLLLRYFRRRLNSRIPELSLLRLFRFYLSFFKHEALAYRWVRVFSLSSTLRCGGGEISNGVISCTISERWSVVKCAPEGSVLLALRIGSFIKLNGRWTGVEDVAKHSCRCEKSSTSVRVVHRFNCSRAAPLVIYVAQELLRGEPLVKLEIAVKALGDVRDLKYYVIIDWLDSYVWPNGGGGGGVVGPRYVWLPGVGVLRRPRGVSPYVIYEEGETPWATDWLVVFDYSDSPFGRYVLVVTPDRPCKVEDAFNDGDTWDGDGVPEYHAICLAYRFSELRAGEVRRVTLYVVPVGYSPRMQSNTVVDSDLDLVPDEVELTAPLIARSVALYESVTRAVAPLLQELASCRREVERVRRARSELEARYSLLLREHDRLRSSYERLREEFNEALRAKDLSIERLRGDVESLSSAVNLLCAACAALASVATASAYLLIKERRRRRTRLSALEPPREAGSASHRGASAQGACITDRGPETSRPVASMPLALTRRKALNLARCSERVGRQDGDQGSVGGGAELHREG